MRLGDYTFDFNPDGMTIPQRSKSVARVNTYAGATTFSWSSILTGMQLELTWDMMPKAQFDAINSKYQAGGQYEFNPDIGTGIISYNVIVANLAAEYERVILDDFDYRRNVTLLFWVVSAASTTTTTTTSTTTSTTSSTTSTTSTTELGPTSTATSTTTTSSTITSSTTTETPPLYPVSLSITNAGAESGDTTGWTNDTGSLAVTTTEPSAYEGTYYFYGGANALTKAYQELDLIADGVIAADIDAGDTQVEVSWRQASFNVSDEAEVYVEFLNSSKVLISTADYGLASQLPAQTWGYKVLRSQIPANTRYVNLFQHMNRTFGTYADGYIDDIYAEVNYKYYSLSITNPGAEAGDTTGWNNDIGSLAVRSSSPNPNSGDYYFYGGANLETEASQELDVLASGVSSSDIDGGNSDIMIEWHQSSFDNKDQAQVKLVFKDSGKSTISSYAPGLTVATSGRWTYKSYQTDVPVNTRYIDIILHMYRNFGTNNDGYVDSVLATIIGP